MANIFLDGRKRTGRSPGGIEALRRDNEETLKIFPTKKSPLRLRGLFLLGDMGSGHEESPRAGEGKPGYSGEEKIRKEPEESS